MREVFGAEYCDEVSDEVDLAGTFTVQADPGAAVAVHGWLVNVVILEKAERA